MPSDEGEAMRPSHTSHKISGRLFVAATVAVGCSSTNGAVDRADGDAPAVDAAPAVDVSDAAAAPVDTSAAASADTDSDKLAAQTAAAKATAESAINACAAIGAFYWEIGDRHGKLASGSVTPAGSSEHYDADTVMAIASASKWLYSGYYVQRRSGVLSDEDIKFLTFRSGYTNFALCLPRDTVDSCLGRAKNGVYTAATDGYFAYDGGHMQKHASLSGLGAMDNETLAAEVRSQIGPEIQMTYSQPQLAGGVETSASQYAVFLRKILSGELAIANLLGAHAVCTNPKTCSQALSSPSPNDANLHYSLGHWVEDDPASGDGSFSSAGAFGFYPWVDAQKTLYGIVSRKAQAGDGAGFQSLACGRLIRLAWKLSTPL